MARYDRASFEKLVNAQGPPQKSMSVVTGYKSNFRGWVTVGGKKCYLKSIWENNFCHYLEWLKVNGKIKDWEYEPRIFEFPKDAYKAGPFYYAPDFLVTELDGSQEWFEVKGYLTGASKTKHKRFKKHYPKEKITLIMQHEMQQIGKYRKLIPGWMTFVPKQ